MCKCFIVSVIEHGRAITELAPQLLYQAKRKVVGRSNSSLVILIYQEPLTVLNKKSVIKGEYRTTTDASEIGRENLEIDGPAVELLGQKQIWMWQCFVYCQSSSRYRTLE